MYGFVISSAHTPKLLNMVALESKQVFFFFLKKKKACN